MPLCVVPARFVAHKCWILFCVCKEKRPVKQLNRQVWSFRNLDFMHFTAFVPYPTGFGLNVNSCVQAGWENSTTIVGWAPTVAINCSLTMCCTVPCNRCMVMGLGWKHFVWINSLIEGQVYVRLVGYCFSFPGQEVQCYTQRVGRDRTEGKAGRETEEKMTISI